ncbi:hypothetical protein EA26_02145 [Vibrio navarrensis]|uniref:Uncharacterized protein n=1 Tax=Vibrio navarrensis TaxID=29495 RepID=A0A099LPM0_9VIBR|nr:hypothetical protein EA26_02145 [Vibrio navarrensis]MBE4616465.1 hypothetical protein [Vibrio navarrensis]
MLGARLLGKEKAEEQERKRRFWVLGPWFWEKKKQVKQETSLLGARLLGKEKAEEQERKRRFWVLGPWS